MSAIKDTQDMKLIRKAVITDLEKIVSLEKESFETPWSREVLRSSIEKSQEWGSFLVVDIDAQVVAYVISKLVLDEVEIMRIAVSNNFRRRGLAKTLIHELIVKAELAGAKKIMLEVNERNLPAINLYQQNGFHKVGERPAYYNANDSAILMDLEIG